MASNYTEHYRLNQWEAEDAVRRVDFNADNAKIDAAIKAVDQRVDGKADVSALAALGQTVAGKGNCRIAAGTYIGTGTYGSLNPNTLDFADTLGKAPELLIVRSPDGGADALILLQGMTSSFRTLSTSWSGGGTICAAWTDTGVSWYNSTNSELQYNYQGGKYQYVAIG